VCPNEEELERCGTADQGTKNVYIISFCNPQYKGHLEDFGIDGRIKLKRTLFNTAREVLDET
jgi:hypothetical protein